MTMLPKVVHELCADEPAAANHDDLHMFIHIAGAERFAFHNGSSIRQVVIFVSFWLAFLYEARSLHSRYEWQWSSVETHALIGIEKIHACSLNSN